MFKLVAAVSAYVAAVSAHGDHQEPLKAGPHSGLWYKYGHSSSWSCSNGLTKA